MKSWKESLDETNTNLQQSLKSSLEKVDLLKQDVFIIHTQVKRVLAPIQWTNNVIESKYIDVSFTKLHELFLFCN